MHSSHEKAKGGIDIHSRPQLTCLDNQTGFVQVGQEVPVITKVESEENDGATITKTTTEKRHVGSIIRVTPRFAERRQSCSTPQFNIPIERPRPVIWGIEGPPRRLIARK